MSTGRLPKHSNAQFFYFVRDVPAMRFVTFGSRPTSAWAFTNQLSKI